MKCKLLKKVLCVGLVLSMVLGLSITSSAAQGSVYSYGNLNLMWTTSSTSAGATLRSGTYAMLEVQIGGDVYENNVKKSSFSASKLEIYNLIVSCSTSRDEGTIRNGYAGGIRGLSQGVSTTIY